MSYSENSWRSRSYSEIPYLGYERPAVLENKDGFDMESIKPGDRGYRDPNRAPKKRLGWHPDKPHGDKNTRGHY